MTVAVGSTSVDASTLMISLKGTLDEVRSALAKGTGDFDETWYRWAGRKEDIIAFSGTTTTWAIIYNVAKP